MQEQTGKDTNDTDVEEIGEKYSVLKELKNTTTVVNLVAVIICFSVISFNYYLISFYLKYVGGNIFINSLASSVSETAGNFAAGFIQKAFGTKKGFLIWFVFAFILSTPLLYFHNTIIIAASVFSCKFFIEGAFLIVYYVNSEVFPPLFVPFSFAICGFVSRSFTIGAPQVAELKPRHVPVIVFLALSVVSMLAAFILRKPKEKIRTKEIKEMTKDL